MPTLTLRFEHTGEEVIIRHALVAAYARVISQVEQLRVECPADDLGQLLTLAGVADHAHERHEAMSRGWQRSLARLDLDEAGIPPGAGRSSADKGQGCPAFAPAVGPAPMHPPTADITIPADPFFCASGLQELPVGASLNIIRPEAGRGDI